MLSYLSSRILFSFILIEGSLSEFKIIELDHDLGPDAPYYITPGAERFSHEVVEASNQRGYWFTFGKYKTEEHTGTHICAPITFYEHGKTVHEIPLEHYFGEAAVIDIRDKVSNDDNYELTEQDVGDWIDRYGVFPNNSFIIINTGWEKGRYPNQLSYFGNDRSVTNLKFPGISLAAMKAILKHEATNGIHIIAMGIDTPDLDHGPSLDYGASRLFASYDKYIVRDLRGLERLPPRGARLMVLPIKLRNGVGAQARVFAKLP